MSDSRQGFSDILPSQPTRWLVTGGAGFIGSHLVETLLACDQVVTVLDDFSTGHRSNLDLILANLTEHQAKRLTLIAGDLADFETCSQACEGVQFILHHGALGSVPASIEDPAAAHRANSTGTHHLFVAGKEAGVRRIVYASSSAVYGNDSRLPKVEDQIGDPLSPYAATKFIAEVYASAFAKCYEMEFVGLRYFNVFGPRQDPNGAYAAVIPAWISAMLRGETVYINGDGETSRDFVNVSDIVQANLRAATVAQLVEPARVFNVARGEQTTLNSLFAEIRTALTAEIPDLSVPDAVHRPFRPGDIRHSHADISRARTELEFTPSIPLALGLTQAMPWYLEMESRTSLIQEPAR